MNPGVLVLFFLSGCSGLIYQVVWVREFGHVFGNTIHSAALVTAVFMGGLGLGGYLAGRWADRRFAGPALGPLRAYAWFEVGVGVLGLGIALILPRLAGLAAWGSAYTPGPHGFLELSAGSHLLRLATAGVLLAAPCLLMGGTLTLLIRLLVRDALPQTGWRVGWLWGANSLGGALGCILCDYLLIPRLGLWATQLGAVGLNLAVGAGALLLARRLAGSPAWTAAPAPQADAGGGPPEAEPPRLVWLASLVLLCSGALAMGLEILWFRLLVSLLGAYRAVFALMLAVLLACMWLGAILAGALQRRLRAPVALLAFAQAALVACALFLPLWVGGGPSGAVATEAVQAAGLWGDLLGAGRYLQVILALVGLPALLMGFMFPLANAVVQRSRSTVGGRAGRLALANTAGNVFGALLAGFVLLPIFGVQTSLSILCLLAGLAVLALIRLARALPEIRARGRLERAAPLAALLAILVCLGVFGVLPGDAVLRKNLEHLRLEAGSQILVSHEGAQETLLIVEHANGERRLMTDGYSMSSTRRPARRYMRAMAHLPLLLQEAPRRVLVICFGVGNTAHAASLHPSVQRLDVVDLSRDILRFAGFFRQTNRDVLSDPRVSAHVNDGRLHLLMTPEGSYDLVTLEPPPLALAGVSALYSREFYALASSRLRPGGMVTQWLPIMQLSEAGNRALVRAFIEVFPGAVLLNGYGQNFILLGQKGGRPLLEPAALAARLDARPAVRADLADVRFAELTEIAGSFAASAEALARGTRGVAALSDDRPVIEYDALGAPAAGVVPLDLLDTRELAAFCPSCLADEALPGLSTYLALLQRLYHSESFYRVRDPAAAPPLVVSLDAESQATLAAHGYLWVLYKLAGWRAP